MWWAWKTTFASSLVRLSMSFSSWSASKRAVPLFPRQVGAYRTVFLFLLDAACPILVHIQHQVLSRISDLSQRS